MSLSLALKDQNVAREQAFVLFDTRTQQGLSASGFLEKTEQLAYAVQLKLDKSFKSAVGKSPKVGICMASGLDAALVNWCACSYFVAVPINPAWSSQELTRVAEHMDLDLLIYDDQQNVEILNQLTSTGVLLVTYRNIEKLSENAAASIDLTNHKETGLILHTSGSTGVPKSVFLAQTNLLSAAKRISKSINLNSQDVVLNSLPMFHIGGLVDLLMAPLVCGAKVVFSGDFEANKVLRIIEQEKVTLIQTVPAMLSALLDEIAHDQPKPNSSAALNSLRLIRSVSSPLSTSLRKRAEEELHTSIIEIYGMSEACGVITTPKDIAAVQPIGTVGQALGVEIKITDKFGNGLAVGLVGEVCIKGPDVIQGYFQDTQQASNVFYGDWFRTGDLAYLDNNQILTLQGRIKEQINRGGEKISPFEVESICLEMQGIKEVAVFSIPHETMGEDVAMILVEETSGCVSLEALRTFLAGKLATYKIPRKIFIRNSIPKSAQGKVQRHLLSEIIKNIESVDFVVPKTRLQKRVSKVFSEILNVERVGLNDNFFDLGGNSLKTISFIRAINKNKLNILTASDIYDNPRLKDICVLLESKERTAADSFLEGREKVLDSIESKIPENILKDLKAYLSLWSGEKLGKNGLLVAKNLSGKKDPMIWVVNCAEELDALAEVLGEEQPIFGFRTLFEVENRKESYIPHLVELFIEDFCSLELKSPLIVAGFCEGVKFSTLMALELQRRSFNIKLLICHEYVYPVQYLGETILFFTESALKNAFLKNHIDPVPVWRKYFYPNITDIVTLHHAHNDSLKKPSVYEFVEKLNAKLALLEKSENTTHSIALIEGNRDLPKLCTEKFDTEIELLDEGPFQIIRKDEIILKVKVRNIGLYDWPESIQGGPCIGVTWTDPLNRMRTVLKGYAYLDTPLRSGKSICVDILIQVPNFKTGQKVFGIFPDIRSYVRSMRVGVFIDGVHWLATGKQASVIKKKLIVPHKIAALLPGKKHEYV